MVTLTNSGNQTVTLSQPDILETHVSVSNKASYNTNVHLGPGSTMTYSFLVTV
jgi:archaellum component FlaF (FlaF/FlaG flagellin family)